MRSPQPSSNELAFFKSLDTIQDLAKLFGTTADRLRFNLYSGKRPGYRKFEVPKKSGGARVILSPPPMIRELQTTLLRYLTTLAPPKESVHGFAIGRSILSNAVTHVPARVVLNLDLEDFFPTINFGRVYGVFRNHPFRFPHNIAVLLAQICCVDKHLPQGAPTSPILSNLVCRSMDRDLNRLARLHGCRYSRYCDDLTFSCNEATFPAALASAAGPRSSPTIGISLGGTINRHGFSINERKTRIRFRSERQEVSGLTINEFANVPRRFIRDLRALLHHCESAGVENANARFLAITGSECRRKSASIRKHVFGKLAFLKMIRGGMNPIYLRLLMRARAVFGVTSGPAPLYGDSALDREFIAHATWILLGFDYKGNQIEGTAFTLCGVGIVTTFHTFDKHVCVRFELRPANRPTETFAVRSIRRHPNFDLAIVLSDAPQSLGFLKVDEPPMPGDDVTLAGFPSWFSPDDQLFISKACVTQLKNAGAESYILIDRDVRGGNSGGPLLSRTGNLIGVAMYDGSSPIAPNGILSAKHIDADLVNAPESPPSPV